MKTQIRQQARGLVNNARAECLLIALRPTAGRSATSAHGKLELPRETDGQFKGILVHYPCFESLAASNVIYRNA